MRYREVEAHIELNHPMDVLILRTEDGSDD